MGKLINLNKHYETTINHLFLSLYKIPKYKEGNVLVYFPNLGCYLFLKKLFSDYYWCFEVKGKLNLEE